MLHMFNRSLIEIAPLIPHLPFVVVYLFAGALAVLRYRRSPPRMTWLLIGLSALLIQHLVEAWISIGVPNDVPHSSVVATASYVRALVYLSWGFAVGGFSCVVVAALKSDARESMV